MKPVVASLIAISTLTSCYVWTPPQQPGAMQQQPQSRYIEAPPQQPAGPANQGPLSAADPGAPQAPNPTYVPPQAPDPQTQTAPQQQKPTEQPKPTEPNKPATPPASAGASMPYGIKVPSKPGFVLSPHDKNARIVDVQGIPSGTKVKCPYTQKTFLVP
jgi:hypothetical protein